MESVKAVIFDMDGTLVDNIPYHKTAWLNFLKKHNIDLKEHEFHAQNHGTMGEMIIRFFGSNLSIKKIKELGEEKEQIYRDLYKTEVKEIDGLSKLLNHFKTKGIKSAIATMGDPRNISFILDTLKIRRCFHSVTGGHEVSKGKPDPEIFELSLKKLGHNPKECIVIEDSIGGIKSAISARMRVVGISTTHSKEELLDNGCTYVISDFTEFRLN